MVVLNFYIRPQPTSTEGGLIGCRCGASRAVKMVHNFESRVGDNSGVGFMRVLDRGLCGEILILAFLEGCTGACW